MVNILQGSGQCFPFPVVYLILAFGLVSVSVLLCRAALSCWDYEI